MPRTPDGRAGANSSASPRESSKPLLIFLLHLSLFFHFISSCSTICLCCTLTHTHPTLQVTHVVTGCRLRGFVAVRFRGKGTQVRVLHAQLVNILLICSPTAAQSIQHMLTLSLTIPPCTHHSASSPFPSYRTPLPTYSHYFASPLYLATVTMATRTSVALTARNEAVGTLVRPIV